MKLLAILSFAVTLTGALAAQDACPHVRAVPVAASSDLGPNVDCGVGIDSTIGGVTIRTGSRGCPLYVLITPSHDRAEATSAPTRVEEIGTVNQLCAFYKCQTSWFLFIPVGSECMLDRVMTIGTLQRLRTESCAGVASI